MLGLMMASAQKYPFDVSKFSSVLYWADAGDTKDTGDGASINANSVIDKSIYKRGAAQASTFPTFKFNGGNLISRPYWNFNGTTQHIRTPSFSVTHPRIFMVCVPSDVGLDGRFWDGNSVNTCYMDYAGIPAGAQINGASGTAQCKTFAMVTDTTKVCLIDAKFNGASSSLQIDGNIKKTGTVTTASVSDGFNVGAAGNNLGGFFKSMKLFEFIVCDDDTLTASQLDYIRRGLISKHRLRTRNLVVADGNSWIAGTGATGGNEMASCLARGFGGPTFVLSSNGGAGGDTTANMPSNVSTEDTYIGHFTHCIFVAWEGRNDIVIGGVSAAQAYLNMKTYMQSRQTSGWQGINSPTPGINNTILLDIDTSGMGMSGGDLTKAQTYNASLLANTAGSGDKISDGYISVDSLLLGPPGADGLHYDNAQQNLVANAILAKARSLGVVVTDT
jgi:hypothetical protein